MQAEIDIFDENDNLQLTSIFVYPIIDSEGRHEMRNKIRELRTEAGMTQGELAEKAGCSRQFIVMIEGDSDISIGSKILVRIAEALGCSLDDIFYAN